MNTHDKTILRELAREYNEAVHSEKHLDAVRRMQAINDLQPVRPPVLIDELPWHELNTEGELTLHCEDPFARGMEDYFRRKLYQTRHFSCDVLMRPHFPVGKSFSVSSSGLTIDEKRVAIQSDNHIVSHEYHDVLRDEEDLARMRMPVVTAHPEEDERHMNQALDALGDVLPVRFSGVGPGTYYSPWDRIPELHGIENTFTDLIERPEFMHAVIQKFTEEGETLFAQYEALGLFDGDEPSLHCTPSYITRKEPHKEGEPWRMNELWFRSMAQLFTSVSPRMHWEFDVAYSLPMMKKFAWTYYGCCEALDKKIPMLKKIPNLRKIGVSPWADVDVCCEAIGKDYVASRKPNPALVATVADPEVIAAEIEATVRAGLRYGCPMEFILKDISTSGRRPENLAVWADTVNRVLDRYY